jgi:tetratricopeptide (TPR) repeat protein
VVLAYAYTLRKIAWNRYNANQAGKGTETGEAEMALSLEQSQRMASREKAGMHEMIEYADTLLKVPYPKLQNPKRAFEFALRGNELSGFQNPMGLDTLAWAYFRTGNVSEAIRIMKKAIALLAPSAEVFRKEMTGALEEFQTAEK